MTIAVVEHIAIGSERFECEEMKGNDAPDSVVMVRVDKPIVIAAGAPCQYRGKNMVVVQSQTSKRRGTDVAAYLWLGWPKQEECVTADRGILTDPRVRDAAWKAMDTLWTEAGMHKRRVGGIVLPDDFRISSDDHDKIREKYEELASLLFGPEPRTGPGGWEWT